MKDRVCGNCINKATGCNKWMDQPATTCKSYVENREIVCGDCENYDPHRLDPCEQQRKYSNGRNTPAKDCPRFHHTNESFDENVLRKNVNPVLKDTNPKLSCGIRKVSVHNIPTGPILEIGLAFMEGHMKYGSHNYRAAGVRASTYYDAVMARHMPSWWEGENIDPESGLSHITKAIASLIVLRDSMLMGNWVDDRPIRYPDGLDITGFNKKASDLIDKYPNPKEPYLAKDNNKVTGQQ